MKVSDGSCSYRGPSGSDHIARKSNLHVVYCYAEDLFPFKFLVLKYSLSKYRLKRVFFFFLISLSAVLTEPDAEELQDQVVHQIC